MREFGGSVKRGTRSFSPGVKSRIRNGKDDQPEDIRFRKLSVKDDE